MNIMDIAERIDKEIRRGGYVMLHPTSIEVNKMAANYSPYTEYKIMANDVISYTLGTNGHKRGKPIPVRCAYTWAREKSDYHYLMRAVSEACYAGMAECGADVRLTEPSKAIEEVLNSYTDEDGIKLNDIKSLYNVCGYNLEDAKQMVPNLEKIPSEMENYCKGRMEEDQIYFIDVYGTNLTKHDVARNVPIPTMFKPLLFKNRKQVNVALNRIKVRHARELYYFIQKNYNTSIFSVRDLEKRCNNSWPKKYKYKPRQIHSLSYEGIIKGIPAKFVDPDYNKKKQTVMKKKTTKKQVRKEKSKTVVVHYGHTIYINDRGNDYLC